MPGFQGVKPCSMNSASSPLTIYAVCGKTPSFGREDGEVDSATHVVAHR